MIQILELMSSSMSLLWNVPILVGLWLVFKKAGERGWKAIIPFCNMYTLFKIGDRKKYWPLYLISSIIVLLTSSYCIAYVCGATFALIEAGGTIDAGLTDIPNILPGILYAGLVAALGYIAMLISVIHGYSGVCKKMDQGAGMVVGLLFLEPIFWMILGASKKYQWKQPAMSETSEPVCNPVE